VVTANITQPVDYLTAASCSNIEAVRLIRRVSRGVGHRSTSKQLLVTSQFTARPHKPRRTFYSQHLNAHVDGPNTW